MIIKTIFFDVGGVICKDIEKHMMRDIAQKYDLYYPIVMTVRHKWWERYATNKISETEYWKGFLKELQIDEQVSQFISLPYEHYILLNEDIIPILKQLKTTMPLHIVSDHAQEWCQFALQKYTLQQYFETMTFSFNIGVLKSNPTFLTKVLQHVNVKPQEILFVDNTENCLKIAKKLGMQTLLFKDVPQLEKKLRKLNVLK